MPPPSSFLASSLAVARITAIRPLSRLAIAMTVAFAAVPMADAFTIDPDTGVMTMPYYINRDSFMASGAVQWADSTFYLSNDTTWEWLINNAISAWRTETALNGKLVPQYLGTASYSAGPSGWGDGHNTIGAITGTSYPCNSSRLCTSQPSNNYTEFDIYCCTNAFAYNIDQAASQVGFDLVGSLTHEFGHATGVNHPYEGNPAGTGPVTVMTFSVGTKDTTRRALFGYDTSEAVNADAPYGMTCSGGSTTHCGPTYTPTGGNPDTPLGVENLNVYWREYFEGYGWGAQHAITTSPAAGVAPAAAVGRMGGHGGAMAVATTSGAGFLNVKYTTYPVHPDSSWTASADAPTLFDVASRPVAPAIAARDRGTTPLWLVAKPVLQDQLDAADCPGIQIWATDDFTDATTPYTVGGGTGSGRICTNHPVSLNYDPRTDRFVLFYLASTNAFDTGLGKTSNYRIHVRISSAGMSPSSSDASDWTTDIDPGMNALDVPVAACHDAYMMTSPGNANCQLSMPLGEPWEDGSYHVFYPFVPQFDFNVLTDGSDLAVTNFGLNTDWSGRSTSATATTLMGDRRFWHGLHWTSSFADVAKGTAGLYTRSDWSLPTATDSWTGSGVTSDHHIALVGSANTERIYAVYVNP